MRGINTRSLHLVIFLLSVFCFLAPTTSTAVPQLTNLRCEYHSNPIGIEVVQPRLSWQLMTSTEEIKQTAYEVQVANSPALLAKKKRLLWTSGKVESDQSAHIVYQGPALSSRQRVYWQVRIWDNHGQVTDWSEPAFWEMGLLQPSNWSASWIHKGGETQGKKSLPVQYLRKEFDLRKKISSARVYVTSLGLYQLFLNGQKVGSDLFTPGWSSYKKRLQYQTYDVTHLLDKRNTIGAMLGDGWYRGYLGWKGGRSYYGDQLALLVQLEITYTDGTSLQILSDEQWKVSYGPIQESDIYNGEKYDARLSLEGWAENGFNDQGWEGVDVVDHTKDILVAPQGVPVQAIEEIKPIEILTTPKGETVMDLGQNMVGWVRMKVNGKAGDQVTLQFAEVLDKEGNFYTTNLRAAEATDIYTLKGGGEEVFEPSFTFHGFRYVKLEGYPGNLSLDDITGVVIHSAMEPSGQFSCSNPLINQLQQNIQWGQKDNFLDIPTDCPQRDERAGWTGDAQVFSKTAAFNFDVAAFYTKWVKDLAVDQLPNGRVPHVIPDILNGQGGATGWADAAVIVPWTVYQVYGDTRILEEQYPSMKAWIQFMQNKAGEDFLWNNPRDWHWGDWLAYNSNRPDYSGSVTEKDLIATAYFYYSTHLLSQIAGIIGNPSDAESLRHLATKIKSAFVQEYLTQNGRLVSNTQTAYALAISFGLIPENLLKKASQYFAADVERFGHLTTGFLGTPLLCSTLSRIGRDDLAFMLLNRKEFPSWLYPVTQGATTIWERWDTQRPDGSIIEGMNSFNHYAYGAIGEWLYQHVAGLKTDPNHPGYKRSLLHPHPGGGLTQAKAEFKSIYGRIKSAWEIMGEDFRYEVIIPANTTAKVNLPGAIFDQLEINGSAPNVAWQEKIKETKTGVELELGSGTYTFTYPAALLN